MSEPEGRVNHQHGSVSFLATQWRVVIGANSTRTRIGVSHDKDGAPMTNPIGPLLAADEGLCHQVTDTFAVVGTSDRAWTEKVCAMAAARDGSLQLGFGLGKYPNRGVLDGYAGVSRGVEQLTVRASRRLSTDPELTVVGPVQYEVVEPMRSVRFSLHPNEHRPLVVRVAL